MKMTKKTMTAQIILSVFLILLTLTMLVPVINILAKSLSGSKASPSMSGLALLPKSFDLINYKVVFSHPVLLPALFNSIIITVVGTLINVLLTTTAAYVLAQPKLTLKRPLMVFFIIMMLFDPGMVPEYLVVQKLGLIGSKWSVILVSACNVYYLVIMMRYFEKIPVSIKEAAVLDGAGHLRCLKDVYFPLAKSGVATITMFYAVVRWNEYFKASIYLTRSSLDTVLQVILRQFVVVGDMTAIIGQQNMFDYNTIAQLDYSALKGATIIVAIIPILMLYPFVLKFYMKDAMAGGIKE